MNELICVFMNQQVNFHEIHIFQLELDNKDNSLPDKTKAPTIAHWDHNP